MKTEIIEAASNLVAVNLTRICAFAVACFCALFTPVSRSLGAVAGKISADLANGSNDAIPVDVLAPPRMTMAELFKLVITSPLCQGRKKVAIDFAARKLHLFPHDAAGGVAGGVEVASLDKDEPAKSSSSLSNVADDIDAEAAPDQAALQDAINESIGASKPSKSASSMINEVENTLARLASEGLAPAGGTIVVVDQSGDGKIRVVVGGAVVATGREAEFAQDTTPVAAEQTLPFEG